MPVFSLCITYNYIQDGVLMNKVVGIFEREELECALNDIRNLYRSQNIEIIKDEYDKSSDNYFLGFDDEDKSYFYTGDYILNELNL